MIRILQSLFSHTLFIHLHRNLNEPEGTKVPFFNGSEFEGMDLKSEISQLVEKFIDDDQIFLVEVIIKGKPGNQKIQIYLDGDEYVGVDSCSSLSRKLSEALDEMDIIEGKYIIEVSSPGVDNPLLFIRQYTKHVGRELEIMTQDKKMVQGILLSVENDTIELSVKSSKVKKKLDSATFKLSFREIETAKVVLRF